MGNETMDMEQLAAYLQRDVREVGRLASRGVLPGYKVGGQWRFARAEINHWVETQLPNYTEKELSALERSGTRTGDRDLLLADLLTPETVAVPLAASTKASVLRELVGLAEQSWVVYDSAAILESVRAREELGSTLLPGGVAIPHLRRPLPAALGEPVMAYARTTTGIPFGGPRGELADLFFLVLSRDDATHLRVLARLTRVLLQPGLLDRLREIESGPDSLAAILDAEAKLVE
jgi:PTS system nitrogen regulatory IIA component